MKRLTTLLTMIVALVTTATADNVLTASSVTLAKGGTADLTINLANTSVVKGVQFTLTLPSGVTVQTSEEGIEYTEGENNESYVPSNNVKVKLTTRTTGWWALGSYCSDGTYKFVLLDPTTNGLAALAEGADPAIMKVTLLAANDATAGEISDGIEISDVHLAISGTTEDTTIDGVTENVTVSEFTLGDCNGNGEIDIDDPVKLLENLAGIHEGTFIEAAADCNRNGEIDIDDPVCLLESLAGLRSLARKLVQQEDDLNLSDPD